MNLLALVRTKRPEGISTSRVCKLLGVNRASVYYKATGSAKESIKQVEPISEKKRIVSPRPIGIEQDIDITGLDEKEARML